MQTFGREEERQITIKVVSAGQSGTTAAVEDTVRVGHLVEIRADRLTQTIFLRENHDLAATAALEARDTLRQVALELVRAGGTRAIERQRDGRAFLVAVTWAICLLAGELCLGRERDVQASDEALRGRRGRAARGNAGVKLVDKFVVTEVGADLFQAGLLGWVLVDEDGSREAREGH